MKVRYFIKGPNALSITYAQSPINSNSMPLLRALCISNSLIYTVRMKGVEPLVDTTFVPTLVSKTSHLNQTHAHPDIVGKTGIEPAN
jgi:hypothetical protein